MTTRPDPEDVLLPRVDRRAPRLVRHEPHDRRRALARVPQEGDRPTDIRWSEAVDEALCVGWIDSVRYRLDEERSAQRFTPRRKGSDWSAINVRKVAELTEQGRMRPAGLAAYEARDPGKTAIYSYEREAASFTEQETARFRADAAAWADWERRPPSYRRAR